MTGSTAPVTATERGLTMWELAGSLLPEMIGLAVTPAAIIACLLVLGSGHPYRNVIALAAPFLALYGLLAGAALMVGQTADTGSDDPTTARGWISLVVGVLILGAGAVSWFRPLRRSVEPRSAGAVTPADATEPGWVSRLRDPSLQLVLGAGLLRAVVNPNVAILISGLGIVVTADATPGAGRRCRAAPGGEHDRLRRPRAGARPRS